MYKIDNFDINSGSFVACFSSLGLSKDEKTRVISIPNNKNIEFPDINVVLGIKPQIDFNSLKKSAYILN